MFYHNLNSSTLTASGTMHCAKCVETSRQLFHHRRPYALGFQFSLAAQIQRALREQTRRAFHMAADHRMSSAERAFPCRIIRAEKRHARRSGMGRQVRQ